MVERAETQQPAPTISYSPLKLLSSVPKWEFVLLISSFVGFNLSFLLAKLMNFNQCYRISFTILFSFIITAQIFILYAFLVQKKISPDFHFSAYFLLALAAFSLLALQLIIIKIIKTQIANEAELNERKPMEDRLIKFFKESKEYKTVVKQQTIEFLKSEAWMKEKKTVEPNSFEEKINAFKAVLTINNSLKKEIFLNVLTNSGEGSAKIDKDLLFDHHKLDIEKSDFDYINSIQRFSKCFDKENSNKMIQEIDGFFNWQHSIIKTLLSSNDEAYATLSDVILKNLESSLETLKTDFAFKVTPIYETINSILQSNPFPDDIFTMMIETDITADSEMLLKLTDIRKLTKPITERCVFIKVNLDKKEKTFEEMEKYLTMQYEDMKKDLEIVKGNLEHLCNQLTAIQSKLTKQPST